MGRRPLSQQVPLTLDDACGNQDKRARAATELEAWAKKRPATTRVKAGSVEESVGESEQMMSLGEWGEARPRHFVALWAICHKRVYRVDPTSELKGLVWKSAIKAAATMLRNEFNEDSEEMATFIRWCWIKEDSKDKWCKSQNITRSVRIDWRKQFNGAMLADWRVELARKGER